MMVMEFADRNGGAVLWQRLVAAARRFGAGDRRRMGNVRAARLFETALSEHLRRDIGL